MTLNVTITDNLHPKFPFTFKSFFGKIYKLTNALFYVNSTDFPIDLLSKPLSKDDYDRIRESPRKHVPNYWSIIKLIIFDRLLADRKLLSDLQDTVTDIDGLDIVIIHTMVSGVLTENVINNKLITYSKYLTEVLKEILKAFEDKQISGLHNSDYKVIKTNIKKKAIEKECARSNTPILEAVTELTDNKLKEYYLSN